MKTIASLLLSSVLITSMNPSVFASERYSEYKNNIEVSNIEKDTLRLKKIIKEGENQSIASQYQYNELGNITFRDYVEGTIEYEYDSNNRVVKVQNKLKLNILSKPSIIHVKENSTSEYTYDSDGKVEKEIKKVFDKSDITLSGEPISIYKIDYYYDGDQLSRKSWTPQVDSDDVKEYAHYSYNQKGLIDKITETKNGVSNSMTLEYDDDGDIVKAVQNKNGIDIIREISYVEDSVYPIYFVDPIKEPKIDLDFFAVSYKLINEMSVIIGENKMNFKYDYKFDDDNKLTETELTFSNNDNIIKTKYLLEY